MESCDTAPELDEVLEVGVASVDAIYQPIRTNLYGLEHHHSDSIDLTVKGLKSGHIVLEPHGRRRTAFFKRRRVQCTSTRSRSVAHMPMLLRPRRLRTMNCRLPITPGRRKEMGSMLLCRALPQGGSTSAWIQCDANAVKTCCFTSTICLISVP